MIIEIIILICVIAVFVLFARRIPDINKTPKTTESKPIKLIDKEFWKPKKPTEEEKLEKLSNFEKGNYYFNEKNFKQAEKYYVIAASKEPENPKIYNRLGIIYLEQKNFRDAKDAFSEALKFDDKKAARHVNYGLACMQLRNFDEAEKSFEKALKLESKNEKYKSLLRDVKQKKKLFEKK